MSVTPVATPLPFVSQEDSAERAPSKLLWMALLPIVVWGAFYASGRIGIWWASVAAALVAAQSLICLGYLTIDLSRGLVLNRGWLRSISESLCWALNLKSRSLWKKVHALGPAPVSSEDVESETWSDQRARARPFRPWYRRLFAPNGQSFPGNPLVLLNLIAYVTYRSVAQLSPSLGGRSSAVAHPDWEIENVPQIFLDIVGMFAWQFAFFAATGFDILAYLLVATVAYVYTWVVSTS